MKEIITLIRVDFDSLENRDPIRETKLGTFVGGDGLTADGKIAEFFRNMEPEKRYLGWDRQVYPQYLFVRDFLK
jgi:hypothetical protein